MNPELRIFVYGTLKKGFSNHDTYCTGVSRIEPARLRGRLYKYTPEIPIMVLPESDILAVGTGNTADDMRTQQGVSAGAFPADAPPNNWKTVSGEILFFDDPDTRLPFIDSLEEFHPDGPSTYLRVLVRAELADGSLTTAWAYVAGFDISKLESYDGQDWFPEN
jgi:gamma-glutamylcyclotransferase (GGCT)/AIG2-like uncharacterized protein YtfP